MYVSPEFQAPFIWVFAKPVRFRLPLEVMTRSGPVPSTVNTTPAKALPVRQAVRSKNRDAAPNFFMAGLLRVN
jgi:hypothetical protein